MTHEKRRYAYEDLYGEEDTLDTCQSCVNEKVHILKQTDISSSSTCRRAEQNEANRSKQTEECDERASYLGLVSRPCRNQNCDEAEDVGRPVQALTLHSRENTELRDDCWREERQTCKADVD